MRDNMDLLTSGTEDLRIYDREGHLRAHVKDGRICGENWQPKGETQGDHPDFQNEVPLDHLSCSMGEILCARF